MCVFIENCIFTDLTSFQKSRRVMSHSPSQQHPVQRKTPDLYSPQSPPPSTPQTAWRQRGSWEQKDEVTSRRLWRTEGGLDLPVSLSYCSVILYYTEATLLCTLSINCWSEAPPHTVHSYWSRGTHTAILGNAKKFK